MSNANAPLMTSFLVACNVSPRIVTYNKQGPLTNSQRKQATPKSSSTILIEIQKIQNATISPTTPIMTPRNLIFVLYLLVLSPIKQGVLDDL